MRAEHERLEGTFRASFGRAPVHRVRAPGRVNLIGEHVDYCGLAVLPMAIPRAVHVAAAARDDRTVRLVNADARFAPRAFELGPAIARGERGDWGEYAKAAAQALVERGVVTRGCDLAIDGDVPRAAGLSSSSALVVACALAMLAANEARVPERELMRLCADGERFVGTRSGGMDQAICLGAVRGHAAMIEFDPITMEHVPVPPDWRFVVADSGVAAEKSGAAREAYNARVEECARALERVRAHLDRRTSSWRELVASFAQDELLSIGSAALDDVHLRRFRHVVTEARRVQSARAAMLAGEARRFGALMDASHASLRDDYAVSCAELDRLVEHARAHGALGARLTGAGFGGCVVALCDASRAEELAGSLRALARPSHDGDPRDAVLVTTPCSGASVERA